MPSPPPRTNPFTLSESENAAAEMSSSSSSSSTSERQIIQGQCSRHRSHTRGAYFILQNLPFHSQEDDHTHGAQLNPADRIENLDATYISPLKQILSSDLNAAGLVRGIFVKLGRRKGYYEFNPIARLVTEPAAFQEQLRELLVYGVIKNSANNEFIWRRVGGDLSSLISLIPYPRVIGCIHGPGSRDFTNSKAFIDYIITSPDEQIYVFVVGKIDNLKSNNQGSLTFVINAYLKVPFSNLDVSHCLSRVISLMETKWGIQTTM